MEAIMALDGTLLLEEIVQAKEVPVLDPIYFRLIYYVLEQGNPPKTA